MADISTLLATPITEPIDKDEVARLLSTAPFINIPGVANVRDIGSLSSSTISPDGKPLVVRNGRLFRSAQFNHITPAGRAKLVELNVGAIFDLRTLAEVRKYGRVPDSDTDPKAGLVDFTEEGIVVYHIPMMDLKAMTQEQQLKMFQDYVKGEDGFLKSYVGTLEIAGESFGKMMRYILEQIRAGDEGKACVWHCHVGKDRTGLFAALVLELVGVSDEAIAQDYALTRVGLEPVREVLAAQFKDMLTAHPEVATAMAASSADVMLKLLDLLRTKYGGARGWFKQCAGLTDEELDEIKAGLLVESA